jgi:hypothetical protein
VFECTAEPPDAPSSAAPPIPSELTSNRLAITPSHGSIPNWYPEETYQEAVTTLNSYLKDYGFAVSIHRPRKNKTGVYKVFICCAKGRRYTSESQGLREGSTRMSECKVEATLTQKNDIERLESGWELQ